ncbi:MAG: ATP-grasp domain-containing protein, partial [Gemmatimonadetes bacterium]|nr:ATP-grasp domain-containing protein [Gemmatimonadota bacterium]
MRRILVTDAEQRSTLAVVRSLGRAGFHVEVCSTLEAPLAGASRFTRAVHRVSDPVGDSRALVGDLTRLVDEQTIEILIPMTDATAAVALQLRQQRPDLLIPFPASEVWHEVSNKRRLFEVAEGLGIPVPRQHVVESKRADFSPAFDLARDVGFPVILKPHRSAVATPARVLKLGVEVAADREDLERRLRGYAEEAFPILIQERIQGPGLGGFFLAMDGEILHGFAHQRLREKPPTGGVSVLRKSVPLRDDVRRHSEALLDHFEWSGVAMVEFKEDAATGEIYLMEINGRFWGSLQLAIDAGVDFPRLLLATFLNRSSSTEANGPVGDRTVQSRWLWGDVD